jgi:dCMP deaminase
MVQFFSNRWITYFFTIAKVVSEQSKDPSTKVGCVVVDNNKHILATGYNGFPVGMRDSDARYNDREFKLRHVCHGEANAICQCAQTGSCFKDAFIFVTLQPCIECAKLIIRSGIKEVHFLIDEEANEKRERALAERGDECVNDWRKSKEDAIRMMVECRINVYSHTVISDPDVHVRVRKTRKYDFSATGEIVEAI